MNISTKDWQNYINKLSQLSGIAGTKMREYVEKNGFSDRQALIEYAYALVTKYGEGTAELACQMYDAIVEMEQLILPYAIPAETPTFNETAKAINGVLKQSPSGQLIDTAVERMVKQAGADTTLKNAIRDKAQFAWIPSGDTCAFCITLASRGWQNISKKALKNGHAEHIHSHCDCQYSIRHNENVNVEGYDPEKYLQMYYQADETAYSNENNIRGHKKNRGEIQMNALRRELYAQNKDAINAQKRENYAAKTDDKE